MSACQVLYGVTMAVKGVSRVVSVELDDVDEFVPDVKGAKGVEGGAGENEVDVPAASAEPGPPVDGGGEEAAPAADGRSAAPARGAGELGTRDLELIPQAPLREVPS